MLRGIQMQAAQDGQNVLSRVPYGFGDRVGGGGVGKFFTA